MKIFIPIAAAISATFMGSVETSTAISSSQAPRDTQLVSREMVPVQNAGSVDISSLVCDDETDEPAVRRVCYSAGAAYAVISVKGVYRQYCGIDRETLSGLLLAPSRDGYYDKIIKGRFICPAGAPINAG